MTKMRSKPTMARLVNLSPYPVEIAILSVFLAILQALRIYEKRHFGTLAYVDRIPWDDNVILLEGLARLEFISQSGTIFAALRHAALLAPHGPIADLQTLLGLVLFDGDFAGPWALNFLWVVLAMVLTRSALSHLPSRLVTMILLLIFAQAVTLPVLTDIKADMKAALFMGCAILILAERVLGSEADRGAAAGALLALASLCKLTAFYLPAMIIVLVVGFEAVACLARALDRNEGKGPGLAVRPLLGDLYAARRRMGTILSIAVIPFALAFLWSTRNYMIPYILQALSSTWGDGLTTLQRAAFYLPPGNNLGAAGWLLLAVPLAAVLLWRSGRSAGVLALGACVFACGLFLAPLAVAKTTNPDFGSYFVGACFGTVMVAMRLLAASAPRWPIAGLLIAGACAGGAVLAMPLKAGEPAPIVRASFEALGDRIVALERTPTPRVLMMFADEAIAYPNLGLLHFQKTRHTPQIYRVDAFPTDDEFHQRLRDTDFVVTLRPTVPGGSAGYRLTPRFETTLDLTRGDQLVARQRGFDRVASLPWRGGNLNLYRNRETTGGRPAGAPSPTEPRAALATDADTVLAAQ